MPDRKASRISLTELVVARGLVRDVADQTNLTVHEARQLLRRVDTKLEDVLNITGPLEIRGDDVTASGVAGLIRLTPTVELEIAPKFLGASWERWREDFFTIASLSRFGRLLPREMISVRAGDRGDLANLIGHAMVQLYHRSRRRPLRTYRTKRWQSFEIDGVVDPESVVLRDPDGFKQSALVLDRDNPWVQTIATALEQLQRDVSSNSLRRQLTRVRHEFAPTRMTPRRPTNHRLPSRHSRWQTMYDLARHILGGYRADLTKAGDLRAPGFTIKTPDTWQELLGHALRIGFDRVVHLEPSYPLGTHAGEAVDVHPDYAIPDEPKPLLLDAKYRSRLARTVGIERSDLYESLVFLRAAGAETLLLLYPRPGGESVDVVGGTRERDSYDVAEMTVVALDVEVRGISESGGFFRFARHLVEGVESYVKSDEPAARWPLAAEEPARWSTMEQREV